MPPGLAVANAYRSEVAILNQGVRNANDGLSNLQIKDGALDNISKLLDRLVDPRHAGGLGRAYLVASRVHAERRVRRRDLGNHP